MYDKLAVRVKRVEVRREQVKDQGKGQQRAIYPAESKKRGLCP